MRTDDLDYHLPPDLIARRPAHRRDEARLLVAPRGSHAAPRHQRVSDLPSLLRPGDLLIVNDTRVLPAKLNALRADTGGRVEGLFIGSRGDDLWHLMLHSGGRLQPGEMLRLGDADALELVEKEPDGSWLARKLGGTPTLALLDRIGAVPLPPYIERARQSDGGADASPDPHDRERYQTVYASTPGAVAAPTAGLHFTAELLHRLESAGVRLARLTLHVGPGTFAPVRVDDLDRHDMHAERFTVPASTLAALLDARREGRRIVPVGTTSVRALESLPDHLDPSRDYAGETRLLIQPGFRFRFTDGLMTNFHLPRSTLLALVAALVGLDRLRALYAAAIEHRYRFYSYGDAMLLLDAGDC